MGVLDDLDLSEEYYKYLKTIMVLTRINLLEKYLDARLEL
jgi:hypothetical protein